MTEPVHPIADLTDSLLGWASQTELELAQRLAGGGLVIAAGLSDDELERIERLYGIFLTRQLLAGADFAALIGVSPALTLTTLVARARRVVEIDDFVSEFLGGLGLATDESSVIDIDEATAAIMAAIPQSLARFELLGAQEATDALSAIVSLCTQAGIVNNEVPALLEYLDAVNAEGAVSSEDLVAAIAQQENLPLLATALQIAPAAITELIDGVAAVRQFAVDHHDSWFDRSREHLTPQLPRPIEFSVVSELRERPVGTVDREASVGVASREMRPRILFDADRSKVYLRLPEQRLPIADDGTRGEITWRVSIEGTTKIYHTGSPWGDTSGFAESLDVHIERPVRELTVQDETNEITWTVPVLAHDDPALVFSSRGTNVTDKVALHHQSLIVVTPQDVTLTDVVSGDDIVADSETAVEGWDKWVARYLDVSHVTSLSAVEPGKNANMETLRSIDPRQRVRFLAPSEPVDFLKTTGGLPVHSESLIAEFPPTPSGRTETWFLSISSFAGAGVAGDEITAPEPLEIPAEGGAFAIFDPELYDAPWVGEYLVRLRGPRNESFRHEFAIVEGVQANVNIVGACRSFRIPSGGGLSETVLTLRSGAKEFAVEPHEVVVGPQQPAADLVVSTEEGDQLPLRFTPPRLNFELPMVSEPPMWRASRVTLRPRDVDMKASLRIRGTGMLGDPKVTVRNNHGAPIKTAKLSSCDGGLTYVAPISAIASSTNSVPSGRIDFEWTDPMSDRRVSVALADIQSTEPETMELVDGIITVTGAGERGLGVWVWPATAPWETARAFSVIDGRVVLPEQLRDAGPLVAQLHIKDPFMTLVTPVASGVTAVTLDQPGHYVGTDPNLGALSAFLAGETEEVPDANEIMPVLWDMVTTGVAQGESARAVRTAFVSNPSAALTGLSESLVPAEKQPGRVVESGLVRAKFTASNDESGSSHHRAPWIAVLELLGSLDAMTDQSGKPIELETDAPAPAGKKLSEGVVAKRALLAEIKELAGENAVAIVKTARDTTLDTACIDQSTVAIAGMAKAQQEALLEMFFSRSKIVPGLIMDDGNRLLAVFETFNKRVELNELLASEGLIKSAVTLLRTLRSTDKNLYSLARIRFDKLDGVDTNAPENMWSLTPVVSLVLALAARMHAHGFISSNKTLDSATPGWAKLADIVPDLVTGDLIAADAIILAMKKPGIA
ncbi:hypothetical protein FRC0316_01467 [Corynebacterium diphtheriae]|nr:hypothetical protein FRC0016_01394 [Corynebacterium diphtheriae]CAB0802303.1 hypothetical protein FRC0213_01395 [Corynebacterium diphtheriae]CAB0849368.1 hypothetical protein FRC0316_01467 [Corynebacterium diphtheriae]CAB0868617.1 hypothetical protein FRC0378_01543 [Corynebacterium diphtheriae]